ncbi:hypothetical protein FHU25_001971 [Clostridium saccharobutylicum]|nr:hypothetical protein [Clostridium saccharobutylicum]
MKLQKNLPEIFEEFGEGRRNALLKLRNLKIRIYL